MSLVQNAQLSLLSLRRAFQILSRKERLHLGLMFGLVLGVAAARILSVFAVMQFVSLAVTPEGQSAGKWHQTMVESFGITGRIEQVTWMAWAVLACLTMAGALNVLNSYAAQRFSRQLEVRLGQALLTYNLQRTYVEFTQLNSASVIADVTKNVPQFVERFVHQAVLMLSAVVLGSAMIGMLILNSPLSGLVFLLILGGGYAGFHALISRSIRHAGHQMLAGNYGKVQTVTELFRGFKEIKVFARSQEYFERFRRWTAQVCNARLRAEIASLLPATSMEVLGLSVVLFLSLLLVSRGQDPAAGFPVIALYAAAGRQISASMGEVFTSLAKMKQVEPLVPVICGKLEGLDRGTRYADAPFQTVTPAEVPFEQSIAINGVRFSYPSVETGQDLTALNGVNLSIPKGSSVAFAGPTGSGKSTLIDIILALLTPAEGSLDIDGLPIDSPARRAGWQQQVGYVPQQIFLIDDSVRANIAFGLADHEIDDAQVKAVAKLAQIDDFITRELPDGYATTVGESGIRLSGGQRQRIGIARALYRNPQVLLFDEATSALDGQTESKVVEAIDTLAGAKTIIVVAHRLDTVKRCDRIFLLEQGRVVDAGTYAELVARSRRFQELAQVIQE